MATPTFADVDAVLAKRDYKAALTALTFGAGAVRERLSKG